MATEKNTPVNIEQLVNQQVEFQNELKDKRKAFRDAEKKNRELKAQIASSLNLPKGVSVVIKKA